MVNYPAPIIDLETVLPYKVLLFYLICNFSCSGYVVLEVTILMRMGKSRWGLPRKKSQAAPGWIRTSEGYVSAPSPLALTPLIFKKCWNQVRPFMVVCDHHYIQGWPFPQCLWDLSLLQEILLFSLETRTVKVKKS